MKVFACLILLSACLQLHSQSVSIESLTIADGLSQGMIYDIEQTQDGFMWFSTKDGLNRYDGYSFEVYTNDPFNPYSITGNEVTRLFEDSRGNLWIVVQGKGIDVLEKTTGRFLHLPVTVFSDQASKLDVNCFLESPDSTIWIGTENGLLAARWLIGSQSMAADPDLRSSASVTLETKGDKPGMEGFYTLSMTADRTQLLSFRDDGLYRYNPATKVLRQVNKTVSYTKGRFTSRGETAWLWTTFNKNDESVMIFENKIVNDFPGWNNKSNAFNTLATDQDGNLIWASRIGNESGIYSLSEKELFRAGVSLEPKLICTLKDNITSLEIDHAGNLWVGTGGYGLRKIRLNHQPFDHYLKGNSVRRILASDSLYMWLGGSELIWKLEDHKNLATPLPDLPRNVVQYYNTKNGGAYIITIDSRHYYLKNADSPLPPPTFVDFGSHDYACIIEDRQGNIWSGGFDAVLMRFEVATGMYSFFDISKQFGKTASVYALHLDPQGDLWVGTTNGMAQIKITDLKFQTGTVQLQDNTITYYQTDPGNPASLRYNFVSSFCDDPHDPDRYIWISTKGGGLSLLDKTSKTFRHFNSHNSGLPNDVVYALLADDQSHIWMSTNRGLSRMTCQESLYDPVNMNADEDGDVSRDLIFHNFRQTDGLQGDEFNTSAAYRLSDGRLLFGGVNGLTAFYPSEIRDRKSAANVTITGLKVNNLEVDYFDKNSPLHKPVHLTNEVILTYKQNLLTLDFALMDFAAPHENRFRYRLHGVDPDWVDSGLNHTANYAQLRPGNYTFEVQGNIGYGDWSPSSMLNIHVTPPWWASWWAYSIYFLLFAGAMYGIIYFFQKRIRLQHQFKLKYEEANRLKELDTFKTQVYTNLTHEFRTPLTVILGMTNQLEAGSWQSTMTEKEKGKVDNALKLIGNNGKNLLHLINQLLDLSKLENKSFQLHLKQADIVPYLRYVTESFQSYANGNNLSLRFMTTFESLLMHFDAEQIKQVMTNLISNAMKFTPSGGDIIVKLTTSDGTLGIHVTDTGIGISANDLPYIFDRFYQVDSSSTRSAQGTGIGLAHAQELVKMMGGTITVTSELTKGTGFHVTVPVTNNTAVSNNAKQNGQDMQSLSVQGSYQSGLMKENQSFSQPDVSESASPLLLIIEDNPDVVSYLRSCLDTQYQIIVAYNGGIGIEKAFEHIPDFIISDVMMPEKDGYQVCDALKNDERTSHIPIILLTAKADAASRMTGLRRGADAYLAKPFNVEELLLQISVLLENRRRIAAYFSKSILQPAEVPQDNPVISQAIEVEDAFLTKVKSVVAAHYTDEDFALPQLCLEIGMSRSQLFRKMKAISDTSPSDLIRSYRLARAKTLLEGGDTTVAEATYQTGFKDPSYFSKIFYDEFGVLPGNIVK